MRTLVMNDDYEVSVVRRALSRLRKDSVFRVSKKTYTPAPGQVDQDEVTVETIDRLQSRMTDDEGEATVTRKTRFA